MGAAGRLLIAGPGRLLEQAMRITPATLTARHDAQVGLIVLGGAHDLSESVRRLGGGHCEYIRVATRWFVEVSE
jgi:hypothetical protein